MAISSRAIIKAIGCDKLSLVRVTGDGYWYFAYDDPAANVYETESIYVMRLNDMALERWVEYGMSFVKRTNDFIENRDLTGNSRFRKV